MIVIVTYNLSLHSLVVSPHDVQAPQAANAIAPAAHVIPP